MSRIHSLDLARGFTVLFIPAIHTVMVYSQPAVVHSWVGFILAFIAEGPGAQLFMMGMGIYITFKARYLFKGVLIRAGMLAAVGYGMNVVKFVIPYWVNFLPYNLLQALQIPQRGWAATVHLFTIGDILQFAAIALVVVHLVYRLQQYYIHSVIYAVLILFLGQLVWDQHSGNGIIDYGLLLIGGQPPRSFFPLFPWLIYPLLGLSIGYGLNADNSEGRVVTFRRLRITGIGCLVVGYLVRWSMLHQSWALSHLSNLLPLTTPDPLPDFYRTQWPETIQHIGIVLLWLWAWNALQRYVLDNPFFRLLRYCSQRITRIYLIQWPLVLWMVPFFGYQQQGLPVSLILMGCVTVLVFSISYGIDALQSYASLLEQEAEARRENDNYTIH